MNSLTDVLRGNGIQRTIKWYLGVSSNGHSNRDHDDKAPDGMGYLILRQTHLGSARNDQLSSPSLNRAQNPFLRSPPCGNYPNPRSMKLGYSHTFAKSSPLHDGFSCLPKNVLVSILRNIWPYPDIFHGENTVIIHFLLLKPSKWSSRWHSSAEFGLQGPWTTPREPVAGSSEATGGVFLRGRWWFLPGRMGGFCREKRQGNWENYNKKEYTHDDSKFSSRKKMGLKPVTWEETITKRNIHMMIQNFRPGKKWDWSL